MITLLFEIGGEVEPITGWTLEENLRNMDRLLESEGFKPLQGSTNEEKFQEVVKLATKWYALTGNLGTPFAGFVTDGGYLGKVFETARSNFSNIFHKAIHYVIGAKDDLVGEVRCSLIHVKFNIWDNNLQFKKIFTRAAYSFGSNFSIVDVAAMTLLEEMGEEEARRIFLG